MSNQGVEVVLRRDRAITAVALAVIVILAWAYVGWFAASMPAMSVAEPVTGNDGTTDTSMPTMDMPGMDMGGPAESILAPAIEPWSAADFGIVAAMWVAMMIGMMIPSAAPMVLLYARVGRGAAAQGKPFAPTAWFLGGYVLAWAAVALAATGAQWALEQAALLSPMMESTSRTLGGVILIGAGVYQWTPLKDSCLGQCRAPLAFVQDHGGFRPDAAGSLRLGLQHGVYCIGCCWALMALLFVGGVMNPLWIAGIAGLVLVEKLVPGAPWISRLAGVLLVAAGIWFLFMP